MKVPASIFFALLSLIISAHAFSLHGAATGGSSFVVSQHASAAHPSATQQSPRSAAQSTLYMGPKAKFGVFSPAVYGAKVALGTDKLNKVRGKAISLHSEQITKFCEFFGAYHLRTKLIKKAKTNGDTLGFLV